VINTAGIKAYTFAASGAMTPVVTTFQVDDPVLLDRRAVLNGVQYLCLADGPYAGMWVDYTHVRRT
jgi:hypothetical protein